MVLFDKQFCNSVLCSKPIRVNTLQLPFWEAVVADMYVMVTGMSKACSGLQVTLAMHQTQYRLSGQVHMYMQLLNQHKQYASTSCPSFLMWTKGYEVSPHYHTVAPLGVAVGGISLCGGVPPSVQQLLTRSHCDTLVPTDHLKPLRHNLGHETHNMLGSVLVPCDACDVMWCHVMVCDTDSLPATTTSRSFRLVVSRHQPWSTSST